MMAPRSVYLHTWLAMTMPSESLICSVHWIVPIVRCTPSREKEITCSCLFPSDSIHIVTGVGHYH